MKKDISITKNEYIKRLMDNGYTLINENKVRLGSLIFKINKTSAKAGTGKKYSFWLTLLKKESDLNLIPDPWK